MLAITSVLLNSPKTYVRGELFVLKRDRASERTVACMNQKHPFSRQFPACGDQTEKEVWCRVCLTIGGVALKLSASQDDGHRSCTLTVKLAHSDKGLFEQHHAALSERLRPESKSILLCMDLVILDYAGELRSGWR